MDIITGLLNDDRRTVLAKLMNGEKVEVPMANRVLLLDLSRNSNDEAFYSMLVQAGYLALIETVKAKTQAAIVTIPNVELMMVWREFILEKVLSDIPRIRTIFDNISNPKAFASDLEYFISDRLSFFDLATAGNENQKYVHEKLYHIFMLGILSAYENVSCKYPLSNRESSNGRYDILAERPNENIIFEFKACSKDEDLEASAEKALAQIETKRYGDGLEKHKPLVKVGIAFYGKRCKVRVSD